MKKWHTAAASSSSAKTPATTDAATTVDGRALVRITGEQNQTDIAMNKCFSMENAPDSEYQK